MIYTAPGDVNRVWCDALSTVLHQGKHVPSRIAMTKELNPAILPVTPGRRLVTAFGRPVNPAFSLAEVVWILTGREDVEMLKWYNSRIGDYSDDGETFNAPYGYRIRSQFDGQDQLADMIQQLKDNPESRQAVLNVWYPPKDRTFAQEGFDHEAGPFITKRETKDRACNLVGHALIREGRLNWLQVMRSNDIMWGTPNNFMQWMHIQEFVARMVGVEPGEYTHVADSLHLYDYHWEEAQLCEHFDLYGELRYEHLPMEAGWHPLNQVAQFEEQARTDGTAFQHDLDPFSYWASVCMVFESWRLWKAGDDLGALLALRRTPDRVLAAAQARFYYWFRWYQEDQYLDCINRLSQWDIPDSVLRWIKAGHKAKS
jgi:thymidylate synthase